MAYVKQEWKNEVLNGAEKYKITRSDGTILAENVSVELITQILQAGTGITAERMNHIEDGIAGAMSANPIGIDLGLGLPSNANHGGYIDFHNNGRQTDYTTRIIETESGQIIVATIDHRKVRFYVEGLIASYNIHDTGWVDMPMVNNWSAHPNHWFRYRKINNIVWYQGIIISNGSTSGVFCVFPPGFRPAMRGVITGVIDDMTPITGYVSSDGAAFFLTNQYGSHISVSGQFVADN